MKNIHTQRDWTEIAEKNIEYSNYIAEQIDRTISSYTEAEKNISNYIAEQIDRTISYTEYLSGSFDNRNTKRNAMRVNKIKKLFSE